MSRYNRQPWTMVPAWVSQTGDLSLQMGVIMASCISYSFYKKGWIKPNRERLWGLISRTEADGAALEAINDIIHALVTKGYLSRDPDGGLKAGLRVRAWERDIDSDYWIDVARIEETSNSIDRIIADLGIK